MPTLAAVRDASYPPLAEDAPIESNRFMRSRGARFPNDPRYLSQKTRWKLRIDGYEAREVEAALNLLTPDDRVLEIGAGLGFMSTVIGVSVGPAAYTAVEANPAMIPYIKATHAANKLEGIEVINALLGPRAAPPRNFYVRRNFLASSMDKGAPEEADAIRSVAKVPVRDVNKLIAEQKPTALICDIEGAEADLIPSMDLSGLRVAVLELHPQWIGQAGVEAVFSAMGAAGLTYFPRRSNGKVVAFKKGW